MPNDTICLIEIPTEQWREMGGRAMYHEHMQHGGDYLCEWHACMRIYLHMPVLRSCVVALLAALMLPQWKRACRHAGLRALPSQPLHANAHVP